MALIALLCADETDRRELHLAIEELGHRVAWAMDLAGALELLRRERPRLFIVAESSHEKTAENFLSELEREAPLLPVLIALKPRDASRAFELLKGGAYEVVSPPWTTENLGACLSKALRFQGTALEVLRPKSRTLVYLLAAALILGAAGIYAVMEKRRRAQALATAALSAPSDWALPYSHPSGLAFDGKEFWITDWFSQSVYRHAASDLRIVSTAHLPKEVPGAIAFVPGALWIASAPRNLVRHMLDERLSVLARVKDTAPQTVGMVYDGLYLWTCDASTNRLHKRILDDALTIVESYDYPGSRPAALSFDGKALWSLDSGNRELLRHDLQSPARATLRKPLPEYRSGLWKPTGLAFARERLWTVAERLPKGEGPARIFSHEIPF